MKLAIVGGISDYLVQTKLDACRNDAVTMLSFLEETKMYSDICFLGQATTSATAKKSISDFIQKHRGNPVDELLFYFSGHGDRDDDDFFYAFADYTAAKKESSGLRNTELDSLIRNLAPELTVKIVDACYSGSTYIKSEDDIEPALQKSAKENQLKKLYFFHSSAATQTSIAGPQFSLFTQAIFNSLVTLTGAVRYRDLMAAVADEMNRTGGPRPTFIVQADSLEVFVNMNTTLTELLSKALAGPLPSPGGSKDLDDLSAEEVVAPGQPAPVVPMSLANLAAKRAQEVYCTQAEAEDNVRLLISLATPQSWPIEVRELYEIQALEQEASEIPNRISIGRWINNLKDDTVFAEPLFETETYRVDEYKEVPKKPSNRSLARVSGFAGLGLRHLLDEDKEYKLETVEKQRQILAGFRYTANPVFPPHILRFQPKLTSLEVYAAYLVCLFSRRTLTCLYSIEHLPYRAWDESDPPRAREWKQHSAPLKSKVKIEELTQTVMGEISDFITTDTRQRLA